MLLSLKKNKNKNKTKQNKTEHKRQPQNKKKTATTHNSLYLHYSWRCYQAIALKDQQIGSTFLGLLPT